MKAKKDTTTKPSETDKVDEYMQNLKHPLVKVIDALRHIILGTHKEIGEEIKWNAPTFFYTGEMQPFNPKEYKGMLWSSICTRKTVSALSSQVAQR